MKAFRIDFAEAGNSKRYQGKSRNPNKALPVLSADWKQIHRFPHITQIFYAVRLSDWFSQKKLHSLTLNLSNLWKSVDLLPIGNAFEDYP
jgi:hypothetical protein